MGKQRFRIKMRNYNLIPQEKDNFCVCSVLQAILKYHWLEATQIEIASRLTPSKEGFYIDDQRIKEFMNEQCFDYNFFRYNATPFNEPDMLLKEMNSNHGIIGINSHIFLLSEFIDPELGAIDPKNGEVLTMNIYKILRDMRNTNGGFGLVKYIK